MTRPDRTGTPSARHARASARAVATAQGPWLLSRLGKRVLRPGGLETTHWLLDQLEVSGRDVVELAPGLGLGARLILQDEPAAYTGVESDEEAARLVSERLPEGPHRVVRGSAPKTGLPAGSADVVVLEAVLSTLEDEQKAAVLAEAHRLLRPGGVCGIHELALRPGELSALEQSGIRRNLTRELRIPSHPLTVPDWEELAGAAGFEPQEMRLVPMALLQPGRLLADEGYGGLLRITGNMVRRPRVARRVLQMRRVFWDHRRHLSGMALVLEKPAG